VTAPARRSGAHPWAWMLLAAAAVVGLDQLTKALVVDSIAMGERNEVLVFLDLVHVENDGVAFGFLGDSSQGLVLAVTLAALALVVGWFAFNRNRPLAWLAVGLLAGGAIGNLIDRLARDGVIDFIDFPAWPSFNVADIAITVGALTLALVALAGPDAGTEADEAPERASG
jgi:signal peptidase II